MNVKYNNYLAKVGIYWLISTYVGSSFALRNMFDWALWFLLITPLKVEEVKVPAWVKAINIAMVFQFASTFVSDELFIPFIFNSGTYVNSGTYGFQYIIVIVGALVASFFHYRFFCHGTGYAKALLQSCVVSVTVYVVFWLLPFLIDLSFLIDISSVLTYRFFASAASAGSAVLFFWFFLGKTKKSILKALIE